MYSGETLVFERKSTYTKEDLVLCGEGKLFDSGLPRLPLPPMLMFDRFTEVSENGGQFEKGLIRAELDIHQDLWFFQCHFKEDPVMPGCLGLDALWQMLGFYLGWLGNSGKGRALGCGEVKFTDQVLPESGVVEYKVEVKKLIQRKLVMGVADAELNCDGKKLYSCKDIKVALFN